MINIVKIVFTSELVLHFERLTGTKIVRVQNEYVNNFTVLFFCLAERNYTGKIEKRVEFITEYRDTFCYRNVMCVKIVCESLSKRKSVHRIKTK